MKQVFGYIRVSTSKQGEQGVSLQEQQEAICRYALRNDLEIITWFDERETAAKRGRPMFNQMLRLLSQNKATGVIIHKIDRSARNLKDWADLGELIDRGIDVHFANESLDLHTRGGRLSADIQAVVAADYIRNLREETRKGFYGRIKQGLFPLPAPIGYIDKGKGQPKEPDPLRAPLVRKSFELYASGKYRLEGLVVEMYRLGLRNRNGGKVTRNGLSRILNNLFYIGLIRLRRTGETFTGAHQPLISKSLFERVQAVLAGKTNARTRHHDFLFRRLLTCTTCNYSLIGECQKGHIYYRCHTSACPITCVREEAVEHKLLETLALLQFNEQESAYMRVKVAQLGRDWTKQQDSSQSALSLRFDQLENRLSRLTDAYIDQMIDKQTFENRKAALLMERKELEESLATVKSAGHSLPNRLAEFLELSTNAYLQYKLATPDEKRALLEIVTSNRSVTCRSLEFTLSLPFSEIAGRLQNSNGGPYRYRPRTLDRVVKKLWTYVKANPAPQTRHKEEEVSF